MDNLNLLYKQLYPSETVLPSSPFYIRLGHATLGNEIIGSVMNATSCNSSSVIAAYWPSKGNNLSDITYSYKNVGIVQHYIKHEAKLRDNSNTEVFSVEHIFAYIIWKQQHVQKDWFGISATVTQTINEAPSMTSFLSVQRINAVCAYCTLNISFDELTEEVFVAIPLTTNFFYSSRYVATTLIVYICMYNTHILLPILYALTLINMLPYSIISKCLFYTQSTPCTTL